MTRDDPPIPIARPSLGPAERQNLMAAFESGWVSGRGPFVTELEARFARAAGAREAVAVSSGTAAVHLALAALGVGAGDEVIVPALTYVAPATCVRYVGARAVLVDAADDWNLDPARVSAALTDRTRAVIAVHLYGRPCDVGALRALLEPRGIPLIEDASQALGARVDGRPVGGMGAVGCFSLYGNKVVAAGEGGVLVASDPALAARARHLRAQALSTEPYYFHDEVGFSYRLSNLSAALACAQLDRLDAFLDERAAIAERYRRALACVDGIELRPALAAGRDEVCWLYSCLVRDGGAAGRDAVIAALAARGIEARPFFVAMSRLPMFTNGRCPVAEDLAARGLSLPTWIGLTEADQARVVEAVADAVTPPRRVLP